jgi:hypothetical protein
LGIKQIQFSLSVLFRQPAQGDAYLVLEWFEIVRDADLDTVILAGLLARKRSVMKLRCY